MSSIWNRLVDAASQIFGILPVANGGTGIASGTSGGIPYYSATTTIASSGALTASRVVLGGGAGATPTSLAFGTSNQVLGMNNGATAYEHKTMAVGTSGSDFAVANAANSITFNLPDAAAAARGAVTTGTQTMAGAKTWNDVQTFKYSGGSATAGSYDTNGSWTLINTTSATLTLEKSSGASLSIWADVTGTNNKVLIQNSSGALQFIANNGSTVFATMSQTGTGQWTFGDTTLIGGATAKGTNIVGRQDQTSATAAVGAGYVGEYLESSQTTGVTLTTGTITEIGSAANGSSPQGIALTPGVWDITGVAHFVAGASTQVSNLEAFIGTATGNSTTGRDLNRNFAALFYSSAGTTVLGSNDPILVVPTWRVAITGTTTYYLKGVATFSVSTMTLQGTIRATRIA